MSLAGDVPIRRTQIVESIEEYVNYLPDGTSIPGEMWESRHRRLLVALVAHLPFLVAIGLYDGTESTLTGADIPATPLPLVAAELGVVATLAAAAAWPRLGRRSRAALASFGLMTTSSLLVQFSGGYIEAHFHFFVVVGAIALYEDWLPFGVGLVYVLVGHGVFATIDPSRVYNHAAAIQYPWSWAVIHAVFIAALTLALMSNWQSIERSREKTRKRIDEVAEKNERIEAAKAEAESRRAEVEQLNEQLSVTAAGYSETMAAAADGDLTVRLDTDTESPELRQIAESFNEMMAEFESTVTEIQTFTDRVAESSEETATGVDTVERASENVTSSVRQISEGATTQQEMLETVSDEMSELSATTEQIAASAQSVAETAQDAGEAVTTAEDAARRAIDSARETQEAVDATVDNVQRLDERMGEIGEITDLIADIAEQTNMLALNANIEAARAGDDGSASEGFAVVAMEVKELAEETQAAAGEIDELIAAAQDRTDTTVTDTRRARDRMDEEVETVREVVETLERAADNVAETDRGVREITEATNDQATTTQDVVTTTERVAEIGTETVDGADSAAEAADRQLSSVSQVSEEAESLAERADRLASSLDSFETSDQRVVVDATAVGDGSRSAGR